MVPSLPWPVKLGYLRPGSYSQEWVANRVVRPQLTERILHIIAKGSKFYKVRGEKVVRSYITKELHNLSTRRLAFDEAPVPVRDKVVVYYPDGSEVPENKWAFYKIDDSVSGVQVDASIIDSENEFEKWMVSYQSSFRGMADPTTFSPVKVLSCDRYQDDQAYKENIDFFFHSLMNPDYTAIDNRDPVITSYKVAYDNWANVAMLNQSADWSLYAHTNLSADEISWKKFGMGTFNDAGIDSTVTAVAGAPPVGMSAVNKIYALRVHNVDDTNARIWVHERSPEGNTFLNPDYDADGTDSDVIVVIGTPATLITLENGLEITIENIGDLAVDESQFIFVNIQQPLRVEELPETMNTNNIWEIQSITPDAVNRSWENELNEDAVAATLALGDLTFDAVEEGDGGNSITITYDDSGAAEETLAITVVGNDITVMLGKTGDTIDTDSDALKTKWDLTSEATDLVTCTGTGATLLAAVAQTPLAGGTSDTIESIQMNIKSVEITRENPFPAKGNVRVQTYATDIGNNCYWEVLFESEMRTLKYCGTSVSAVGVYPAVEIFGLKITFEKPAVPATSFSNITFGHDTFFLMAPKTFKNYGVKNLTLDTVSNDSDDHSLYSTRFSGTISYLEGVVNSLNTPQTIIVNNIVPNSISPTIGEDTIFNTGRVDRGEYGGFVLRNLGSLIGSQTITVDCSSDALVDWSMTNSYSDEIDFETGLLTDVNGLITGTMGAKYIVLTQSAFMDSVYIVNKAVGNRLESDSWSVPLNAVGNDLHNIIVIEDTVVSDFYVKYHYVGNEPNPGEPYYLNALINRDVAHYSNTYLLNLDPSEGVYETEAEHFLGPMININNDALVGARIAMAMGATKLAITLVQDQDGDDVYQNVDYATAIEIAKTYSKSTDIVVLNGLHNIGSIISMARFRNDPFKNYYSMYWSGPQSNLPMGDENTPDSIVGSVVGSLSNAGEDNITGCFPFSSIRKGVIDVVLDSGMTLEKDVDGSFVALSLAAMVTAFGHPGRESILRKTIGAFKSLEEADIDTSGSYNMIWLEDVGNSNYRIGEDYTTSKFEVFKHIPDQILKQMVKKAIDNTMNNLIGVTTSSKAVAAGDIYTTLFMALMLLVGDGTIAPYQELDENENGTGIIRDLDQDDVSVFYNNAVKGEFYHVYRFFGFERIKILKAVYRFMI